MLVSNINSDFIFENFSNFVIKKLMEQYVQKISSTPLQSRCFGNTG